MVEFSFDSHPHIPRRSLATPRSLLCDHMPYGLRNQGAQDAAMELPAGGERALRAALVAPEIEDEDDVSDAGADAVAAGSDEEDDEEEEEEGEEEPEDDDEVAATESFSGGGEEEQDVEGFEQGAEEDDDDDEEEEEEEAIVVVPVLPIHRNPKGKGPMRRRRKVHSTEPTRLCNNPQPSDFLLCVIALGAA